MVTIQEFPATDELPKIQEFEPEPSESSPSFTTPKVAKPASSALESFALVSTLSQLPSELFGQSDESKANAENVTANRMALGVQQSAELSKQISKKWDAIIAMAQESRPENVPMFEARRDAELRSVGTEPLGPGTVTTPKTTPEDITTLTGIKGRPASLLAKAASGVSGVAEGLAQPEGALMFVPGGAAGFVAQMASNVPAKLGEAAGAYSAGDTENGDAAIIDAGVNAGMLVIPAKLAKSKVNSLDDIVGPKEAQSIRESVMGSQLQMPKGAEPPIKPSEVANANPVEIPVENVRSQTPRPVAQMAGGKPGEIQQPAGAQEGEIVPASVPQEITAQSILLKPKGETSPAEIAAMSEPEYIELHAAKSPTGSKIFDMSSDSTTWALKNPDASVPELEKIRDDLAAKNKESDYTLADRTQWFSDAIHALKKDEVGRMNIATVTGKPVESKSATDYSTVGKDIGLSFDGLTDAQGVTPKISFTFRNLPKDDPAYKATITLPADATPEQVLAKAKTVAEDFRGTQTTDKTESFDSNVPPEKLDEFRQKWNAEHPEISYDRAVELEGHEYPRIDAAYFNFDKLTPKEQKLTIKRAEEDLASQKRYVKEKYRVGRISAANLKGTDFEGRSMSEHKSALKTQKQFEQRLARFKSTAKSEPIPQGPGVVGMGGATHGEVESGAGADIHGIAARVRAEREKSGQTAPTVPGQGVASVDTINHGRELLAKGFDLQKAVDDFEKTKSVSYDALAGVRAKGEEVAQAARAIEEKFGTTSKEYLTARDALSYWDAKSKAMQTEWHRLGMAQQGEVDIDTGTFTGINRAFHDVTGKDLNPAQTQTAKKIASKVSKAEQAVEPAKISLQSAIDNLGPGNKPIYSDYVIKLAEKIVKKLDDRADASRKALAAMSARFNVGLDPTIIGHLANIGASHIGHLGLDFVKWSDAMMKDVGPKIEPYLKDIFARSQKLVDSEGDLHGPNADAVKKVVKRVRPVKQVVPENLADQQKVFSDYKSGQPMNPDQIRTLWNRVKSEYIDKGNDKQGDIVHKVATDFGIPAKDVLKGLSQTKSVKRVADDVWQKQKEVRRLKQNAKQWVSNADKIWVAKVIPKTARVMFGMKTALHGTVALGTHAPLTAFTNPIHFSHNFGEMYRMVASPQYYEMKVHELVRRDNYTTAQRAGLVNDPNKFEDFNNPQMAQQYPALAKYFGRLAGMGNRGYFVLKILRQDLFDQHWDSLSESQKSPAMAKAIADTINHITGVVKTGSHPAASLALFAPKLELSRVSVLAADPIRAGLNLLKMKNISPEEKWFAVNQAKQAAKILSVWAGLLYANQQLNNAIGSKQTVNITDPMKSDWMKFKTGGMNFSWGGPFLTMTRLPMRLARIGFGDGGKTKNLIYPDESMVNEAFGYLRTQASPMAGTALNLIFKADYQNRPLPQIPGYGAPPPVPKRLREQGIKPYTWPEFISETVLPIPFAEGAKEVFHYGNGTTPQQEKNLLKAFSIVMIMGATGGRIGEDWTLNQKKPTIPNIPYR